MGNRIFYIAEINGDTSFQHVTLNVNVSADVFISEDGVELARVSNKGIRDRKERSISDSDTPEIADLSVEISVNNKDAEIGTNVIFTISATNNGPKDATKVEVTYDIPTGYTFVSATPTKGTWENSNWKIEELCDKETVTIEIIATVKSGDYEAKVTISGNEQDNHQSNDSMIIKNRLFVVKTINKKFDSGAPSAGITKDKKKETEAFIVNNMGNPKMFTSDCIAYLNTIEITPKESTRKEMVRIVSQDDGTGGSYTAKPQNNREYGGSISKKGVVNESERGAINDGTRNNASISITSFPGESTFHSHPSGTVEEEEKKSQNMGTSVPGYGDGKSTRHQDHAPSNNFLDGAIRKGDIYNAINDGSDSETIKYVFARKDPKKVYIYNNHGVLATLPHEYFITFKK